MSSEPVQNTKSIFDRMVIRQPVALSWKPKPDITTFELAQCLPLFNMREPFAAEDYYKTLPDEVKRHIEVSA